VTAGKDEAVFLSIRLKDAPLRAGSDNNVSGRRRFNEPESGHHSQEADEENGRQSRTATEPEGFGEERHKPPRSNLFRHKSQKESIAQAKAGPYILLLMLLDLELALLSTRSGLAVQESRVFDPRLPAVFPDPKAEIYRRPTKREVEGLFHGTLRRYTWQNRNKLPLTSVRDGFSGQMQSSAFT